MLRVLSNKFHNLKLNAKFIGSIAFVLLFITLLDISYSANKELEITHKAVKEWTRLFADNVRVSLNTLMRQEKMDMRFELFKAMSGELEGLDNVRVIRGPRTDELIKEFNEKDVIPRLIEIRKSIEVQIREMQAVLLTLEDEDEKEELLERIEEAQSDIEDIDKKIIDANKPAIVDPREEPQDELDREVLATGIPIYRFVGDKARVLIPYTTKKEGCAEDEGCHKYSKVGDVLGAINMEFSTAAINREIRTDNIVMAGFWILRFVAIVALIAILLSAIITKNLRRMLATFKRMSEGDLAVRLPVGGRDEIGELGAGFNSMASSLEETKKELDKRLVEIYALYNVSKTANASFESEQLLVQIVKDISKSIDVDRIMILLREGARDHFEVASYMGFTKDEVSNINIELGAGFYGRVAASGDSQVIVSVDDDVTIGAVEIINPEVNSIIAVPFLRRGAVLGMICAFKDRPYRFDQTDIKLFDSVAEHLAVALENARLFEATKKMAITDVLTGLFNKRYFLDVLGREIERAKRSNHPLAVFLMDLDNFKFYNDNHGHPAGDQLLKEIGGIIHSSIRTIDIACRYGGEEFVVILPETDRKGAMIIAQKLVDKISRHPFAFREAQPLGFVSASLGLAVFPDDETDSDKLVKAADKALYAAKHAGKNRVVAAS